MCFEAVTFRNIRFHPNNYPRLDSKRKDAANEDAAADPGDTHRPGRNTGTFTTSDVQALGLRV